MADRDTSTLDDDLAAAFDNQNKQSDTSADEGESLSLIHI